MWCWADVGEDTYLYQNARREAFSHWLAKVSTDTIRKELQAYKYKVDHCVVLYPETASIFKAFCILCFQEKANKLSSIEIADVCKIYLVSFYVQSKKIKTETSC